MISLEVGGHVGCMLHMTPIHDVGDVAAGGLLVLEVDWLLGHVVAAVDLEELPGDAQHVGHLGGGAGRLVGGRSWPGDGWTIVR